MNHSTEAPLQGCAIMVVEDEFFQAEDFARALSNAGGRLVGPFPSVPAALAALERGERVDAAVLDVNLRGVAVSPVAEALAVIPVAVAYDVLLTPFVLPVTMRLFRRIRPHQVAY